MKNLLKAFTTGLLTLCLTLSLVALPLTAHAQSSDPVTCSDETLKGLAGVTESDDDGSGTFFVAEITEPLNDFEQKIQSGSVDVSAVYWKYTCEFENEDGDTETVNGYIAYEAGGCPDDADCAIVQLIKAQSGTGILKVYVATVYRWGAGIVGIVAVLVIVVSGIQISADQGGGEGLSAAKNRITQSLAALVVLFLSALILYTINPTFFQQ